MVHTIILVTAFLFVASADAAPISVAGYTFDAGEEAFADDAFLVSGSVRSNCVATGGTAASSVAEALSGSDVVQCVNSTTAIGGIVEVRFIDNWIVNNPGADLVVFELSGPQSVGTADSRERFGVSIFDGSSFSAFTDFSPIATGFNSGPDPTLDVFAVEIDLTSFGIASSAAVSRIQLHIFDTGGGTKSGDVAALGALHSIPEPSALGLVAAGLSALAMLQRRRGRSSGARASIGAARWGSARLRSS